MASAFPAAAFPTELDTLLPDLPAEVRLLLRQIPAGRVTTYGDIARALGDDKTRSARWLGEFLAHHEHHADCPCHRVVRSNGEIGLSVCGDPLVKARRLQEEGIAVTTAGRVDLSQRFTEFHSARPLERLRAFQKQLAQRATSSPLASPPKTIGAVDVAYPDAHSARAAYVLLDAASLQVQAERTLTRPVRFPYIPGYLTFRELPVLLEMCLHVREQGLLADLLFVDGNGRLHPWRAGIATCLGVALDQPVVGIGKSLLCGKLEPAAPPDLPVAILDDGELIGMAVSPPGHSNRFYVSVGHRIALPQAVEQACACTRSRALPEPVFLADRLSKSKRKHLSENSMSKSEM